MGNGEFLKKRGWKRIGSDPPELTIPSYEMWRLGWEPFCVELEVWENKEIRGRLCAPGLKVQGTMVFEYLRNVPDAVDFLEKLLEGAIRSLPSNVVPIHQIEEESK